MPTPSRRRTVTLRDGARVLLRPIAPEDSPLLAASFERLSEESRYRRFFTTKNKLSPAELEYLADVDHTDHEAIIGVEPSTGEMLGVARYIRSPDDASLAEVAVTVADDWQRRGLGRALLDRLTYRARREGVRRFSALVQSDNRASIGLLEGVGDTRRRWETGEVELVIELPPQRGVGARLARALRAAGSGRLVPAQTLAHRFAAGARPAPSPPPQPGLPIRTIVVGVHSSPTGADTLVAAVRLATVLEAALHVVTASSDADSEAMLAAATRAAGAEGLECVTHPRSEAPPEALLAVAEEHGADLLIVDGSSMGRPLRFLVGSEPNEVSHHAPCSILIVRTDA